jgi:hypothetical protein
MKSRCATPKYRRRWGALLIGAFAILLRFTPGPAKAGVLTGSWEERRDACTLTLEVYDGVSLVLRMRPDGATFAGPCPIAAEGLAAALDALLGKAAAGTGARAQLSLSLGRVVELPGLSAALAEAARASPGWDPVSARPRQGDVNAFVASLLLQSAVLRGFLPAYSIESVSVEKVLVPTPRAVRERTATDGVPDGRLPYDAQLWVRVRRR